MKYTDLCAQADKALEGVTEGPWVDQSENYDDCDEEWPRHFVCHPGTECDVTTVCNMTPWSLKSQEQATVDARFIAFTRQWVPEAAARIAALTATVAETDAMLAKTAGLLKRVEDDRVEKIAKLEAAERDNATLRDRLARMEGVEAERDRAVLEEKMRMMAWCSKRQAITSKAWQRAARKALAGDMSELRNRIDMIDAGPLDIVLSGDACAEAAARLSALTAERDGLLTTWAESRERHLAAEAEAATLRDRLARMEGVGSERPDAPAHIVEYTNYRGETARRCIIPIRMWWGSTEWHPEEQWMLTAWDLDKNASRDFAWQDMRPVQNPGTSAAIRAIPAADARAEAQAARAVADALDAWADIQREGRQIDASITGLRDMAKAVRALITEKQQ